MTAFAQKNDQRLFNPGNRRRRDYQAINQPTDSFANRAAGFLDSIAGAALFIPLHADIGETAPALTATAKPVPKAPTARRHQFPTPAFA
jgi:hypothetical protein